MWLPLDASTSPLNAHGEVRTRNFPIYVLNDSHKTLHARAKVIKVVACFFVFCVACFSLNVFFIIFFRIGTKAVGF